MEQEANIKQKYNINDSKELKPLIQDVEEQFKKQFNREPRWITMAPGRVNLIGEHVDYNDGYVLPMAIEKYMVVAADYRDKVVKDNKATLCIHSTALNETKTIENVYEDKILSVSNWTDYIRGVLAGFQSINIQLPSLDILIHGNVPFGSGLSSSAALEVAIATLFEIISDRRLDEIDKIKLCQKAEHEYAGVPCGIMDQYCVVKGKKDHLLLLDCKTITSDKIPFLDPDVAILIINSNVKHNLSASEYPKRLKECREAARILGVKSLREASLDKLEEYKQKLEPTLFKRARHVISEIDRTQKTAEAIKNGNWKYAGVLMFESHASLRDDYEVSCPELDILVDTAYQISEKWRGIFGSRMTGGGFGGCTVSVVQIDSIPAIKQEIITQYRTKTGIEPTFYSTKPAQGTSVLKKTI